MTWTPDYFDMLSTGSVRGDSMIDKLCQPVIYVLFVTEKYVIKTLDL